MKTPRLALLAAPALTIVYGLVRLLDGLDGTRGPGVPWTAGHLAFLAALVLFAPIIRWARRAAGGGAIATTAAVVAVVGVVCSLAQIGIDIVVGVVAADQAEMRSMFADVQDVPGVAFAVYGPGTALFLLGLLALVVRLAVRRVVAWWSPVLMALSIGAVAAGLDLLPLGGLLMLAALAPMARRVPAPA